MNAATMIVRARSALVTGNPFFGVLALHLDVSERPDITDTMATDGAALYYAAPFVESLTEAELLGVIAHEVLHCAYGHHVRLGARDPRRWNEAADYAINRDLRDAGFKLPDRHLYDPAFDGMGAEEIYSARGKQSSKPASQSGNPGQAQSASQSGNGTQSGQGGAPTSGSVGTKGGPGGANGQPAGAPSASQAGVHGIGGVLPAVDAAKEADRWQVLARQAINVARAQAGHLPGYLAGLVAALAAPAVDFRALLAEFIDSRMAFDFSFMRPNRRFAHLGIIIPGAISDGLSHVVFAVDTSGSMTQATLDAAISEIAGAMESGKFAKLTVLQADTRVCSVAEYVSGDDIEAKLCGGGGTDFRDTFRWIEANAPDASAIVYLTDLKVDHFGIEPTAPVLWAVYGDSREFDRLASRVPFGRPVYIGNI